MKSGLTIVEMAQQIERQSKLKQDYLLDTRRLQVEPFGSQLYLHTFDDHDDPLVEPLEINQIAHRQIGTHLKIPAAYYDRMLSDYPELLAENVNSWFQREPTQRMVRTLDGTVRAFLSNRYRRIDNLDIAEIVLPVIQQMEDAYFESCQITDSRMYIKVVNKRLEAEVVPGDIVQSGVIISNSEVGLGSVNIQPLVYRLVCSNGMVVNDAQTRRTHIGRVNEAAIIAMTAPIRIVMLPLKSPLSLFMFDTILFLNLLENKKRGTAPSFQFHSEKLDTVPLGRRSKLLRQGFTVAVQYLCERWCGFRSNVRVILLSVRCGGLFGEETKVI